MSFLDEVTGLTESYVIYGITAVNAQRFRYNKKACSRCQSYVVERLIACCIVVGEAPAIYTGVALSRSPCRRPAGALRPHYC